MKNMSMYFSTFYIVYNMNSVKEEGKSNYKVELITYRESDSISLINF